MYQVDYKEIEEETFNCHNECRNNPFGYIIKLKELTNYFNDKLYHHPYEAPILTHEGIAPIDDAITYLKSLKPLSSLIYSEEISRACRDHIADIGPKGLLSHEGSDGKNITDRIEKYCEWDGIVAENLDFGFILGENIVMNMILDDGIKVKTQRKNIFNKEFNYIGVGAGYHKTFGICVVVGYAKNIRKIGDVPENVNDWVTKFYEEEKREEDANFIQNIEGVVNNNQFNKNNYNRGLVNEFKLIEYDAPESSVSLKITKNKKFINGEEKYYTKKTFLLKNGINHIVEIEEAPNY